MRFFAACALVTCCAAQSIQPIPVEAPASFGKSPQWRISYMHDEDDSEFALNDLVAVSPTNVVAAGYLNVKGRVRATALVTNDGGKQWRQVELKEPAVSLFFLDSAHGWVVTTKNLYVTVEGGFQWKKVGKLPEGMQRVVFRTPTDGWTFGLGKIIYRTADGGKTWIKVPESAVLELTTENTVFRWMEFLDANRAILVGNAQPKRAGASSVPDWVSPESSMRRRQLPGSIVLLETNDGGKTWASQVGSVMGTVLRLRLAGEQGLAVFNYSDEFDWPAEIFRLDLKTRRNAPIFRRKDRKVTDAAVLKDGTIVLAAVEAPRVRSAPIPGRLRILRSADGKVWTEMAVDYRAAGRRAFLSAAGDSLWVATDEGMILKLGE